MYSAIRDKKGDLSFWERNDNVGYARSFFSCQQSLPKMRSLR